MKKNVVVILSFIGFFLLSSSFGTSATRNLSEKDITIDVRGELAGQKIVVYVRDGETQSKIMQFEGEDSVSKKGQKLSCKRVKVYGETFELTVNIGALRYVFDVICEQGMQCTFYKDADSVYLQRIANEDLSSAEEQSVAVTTQDIYMRFSGNIIGKQVELYVDSRMVFNERLESENLSYCKESRFQADSPLFNVRVMVDGQRSSFDVDTAKGCFIDFDFQNRFLRLKQYLSEDAMPGLL